MLQAGRSPVRVPDEVDVFNLPNPSSRIMALGSTQPLIEMSIFVGVKSGRRVGLTTLQPIVNRMSENFGASTSRNPKGLHGLYRDNFTITFLHGSDISVFLTRQTVRFNELELTDRQCMRLIPQWQNIPCNILNKYRRRWKTCEPEMQITFYVTTQYSWYAVSG
jgi:hypothetical protein